MGFRYLIEKHVSKGMMVQMFQNGILKSNHLLPNELFQKKTHTQVGSGRRTNVEMLLEKKGVIIYSY